MELLTLGTLLVLGFGAIAPGYTRWRRGRRAHLDAAFERTGYGGGHVLVTNGPGGAATELQARLECPNSRAGDPMAGIAPQRFRYDRLLPGGEWQVPVQFYPEIMTPPILVHLAWTDTSGSQTATIPVSWAQ